MIEQTIRQKLPEGFQRSEFLLQHGFLDAIVERKDLKAYLEQALCWFLDCSPSAGGRGRRGALESRWNQGLRRRRCG